MKDTLAHIVAWSDVLNIRLEMLARGETPQEYEDDGQNQRRILPGPP